MRPGYFFLRSGDWKKYCGNTRRHKSSWSLQYRERFAPMQCSASHAWDFPAAVNTHRGTGSKTTYRLYIKWRSYRSYNLPMTNIAIINLAHSTAFQLFPCRQIWTFFLQTIQVMTGFSGTLAVPPPLQTLVRHMGKPVWLSLPHFSISTICLQSPAKPTTTLAKVLGERAWDAPALSWVAGQMLGCSSWPRRKYGQNPSEGW